MGLTEGLQHEVITEIKRVADQIGRVPTRVDFRQLSAISDRQMRNAFPTWSDALRAAGMEPVQDHKPRKPKVDMNEIMYRPIAEEIAKVPKRSALVTRSDDSPTILCIGDAHFPFACPDTLSQIYEFAERTKPEVVVQCGDLMDLYSFSAFPRSLNYYNPFEEIQLARKMASEMWATLQRMSPGARCVQLWGNHSVRPHKRLLESAPELEPFFDLAKVYTFDGVELQEDYRTEVIIGDTAFIHGYYSGPIGKHRDYMAMNCVTAHTHRGGVTFKRYGDRTLYELNAGYIGLPNAKVFSYTPQKITHWTKGFGFIDALGPRFISCG